MAPIGKIYSYPNNPRAFKCLIAAKYVGVQVDYPAFQFGTDNKTPAFLEKFPLGKVPCFETADGRPIFESNAIAHYIAAQKKEAGLLGNNAYEEALVQTWLNFADNEITPPAATWIYPFLGFIKYNKENTERAQADVKRSLGALDKWLASRTYLAAENITFADIAVTIALLPLFTRVLDAAARKQFVNVNRYMLTMVNQPNFIAVLGEVKFAEKVEVYDPAVHGQAAAAAASSSKKEKKEEKKEEKPKEEKKKEEKKPKKEEEEEPEESYEDEPKGKNPLDMLPPTKFKLDDFKRFYSNNAEADSIKYFWDNFDAEGYSIWRCDYKYNNENTKVYMTCNLLNGFFQRIDRVRKYGFGSFLIFGVDDDNEIKGRWVFRGQEVPAEVQEAADYESYEFEKLDHTNKEVRETFNAFLAWAEIDGLAKFHNVTTKKLDQGKIFK